MAGDIVAKIKKLLALAGSDNPNEAALAAARAQELMVQHAIEESQLQDSPNAVKEPIETERMGLATKKIPHWQAILANVLAKSFFCRVYYTRGVDIYMVGRKSDREVLLATFNYLCYEIRRMADVAFARAETYEHGKKWKTGFCEGAVYTVSQRLSAEMKKLQADNTGTAIVLVNRAKEVDVWVDENLKLSQGTHRGTTSTGWYEGQKAGHALNLSARAGASKALKE